MVFRAHNFDLVIEDQMNIELWRGKPSGQEVRRVIHIPDCEECLIFCKLAEGELARSNLHRCNLNGEIVWTAELVPGQGADYYVDFNFNEGVLEAYSSSGFSVQLDVATGKISKSEFVK